jgi:glycosyltransferase involved in cell wall biosynthesis
MAARGLSVLTFTTLYPSVAQPRHGIFVASRLAALQRHAGVRSTVIAPVPWFPSTAPRFGRWARYASTPAEEPGYGGRVHHPRYPAAPGLAMYGQPPALAWCGARCALRLARTGAQWDLVDAQYLYPDGVAGAVLARRLRKPLVLTARGSDVNVLGTRRLPRRLLLAAARQAEAVIAVSGALAERLVALGVDRERVHVLRNGVDTTLFQRQDRGEARARLGLDHGPVFASVGNLVPGKGHDLAIEAAAHIPDAILLVVGAGPCREALARTANAAGMAERVQFIAELPQRDLVTVYAAADALVLASASEGWPNVLLEAMACGTPVVATAVGGVPEIVTEPTAGIVVQERSSEALASALRAIVDAPRAPAAVAAYAARFGWEEVALRQAALYAEIVAAWPRRRSPALASRRTVAP